MAQIILWGATGQAKVLHEALKGTDIDIAAIVDDRNLTSPVSGIPILLGEAGLSDWLARHKGRSELLFAIAVGGSRGADRSQLFDLLKAHRLRPHTIVHRAAFFAADAHLGEGGQVLAMAAACAQARLGALVLFNPPAAVGHDCAI